MEQSLLAAQLKGTSEQIEAQAERIQKSEKFTGDVDQLRDEIEQARGVIKEMSNELTTRNIEIDAPPRVTILEAAGKAEVVQPARRWIVTGVTGFLGFLLGLMAIIFVRFLRREPNASQEASTEATTLRRPNWGSSLFPHCSWERHAEHSSGIGCQPVRGFGIFAGQCHDPVDLARRKWT